MMRMMAMLAMLALEFSLGQVVPALLCSHNGRNLSITWISDHDVVAEF